MKPEQIIDEIQTINKILEDVSKSAKLIILLHKIDLIPEAIRNNIKIFTYQIQNLINLPNKPDIFFTSIEENYLYSVQNAFSNILSSFSVETKKIKETIDQILQGAPETLCFITNRNNNMIAQAKSNDFNINLIYDSYRIYYHINQKP